MKRILITGLLAVTMAFAVSGAVFSHCDTYEGPVIQEAKTALEANDPTPLLKWVPQKEEASVKAAFEKALKERVNDKEKADKDFFEVLVRIHRENEGAAFTGIKPAGTAVEPAVMAADQSIATGSPDELTRDLSNAMTQGIRERFERLQEAQKHMHESVESGRAYVAAYVDYTHYVEGISKSISNVSGHGRRGGNAGEEHRHNQ